MSPAFGGNPEDRFCRVEAQMAPDTVPPMGLGQAMLLVVLKGMEDHEQLTVVIVCISSWEMISGTVSIMDL